MSATAPKTNGRAPRAPRIEAAPEPPRAAGLADALLAFAGEAPKLRRDADGQIQSRTYRYATLDSVLDDVAPLLVKHQLVFTAKAVLADGQPAARYRMTHVPSGETDEWTGPLPCVDPGPQAMGSAITYMRRYELVAYLNLAPGEDDDGHAASTPVVDRYAEAEAAHARREIPDVVVPPLNDPAHDPAPQPTAAPPKPSRRPATAKQRKMIQARAAAIDLTAEEMANILKVAGGEQRTDWEAGAAERWAARALDRLPADLVNAVLEGIARKAG